MQLLAFFLTLRSHDYILWKFFIQVCIENIINKPLSIIFFRLDNGLWSSPDFETDFKV